MKTQEDCYRVYFSIVDFIVEPMESTEYLGILPTETYKEGDEK